MGSGTSFNGGALLGKLLPLPVSIGVFGSNGIAELSFTSGALEGKLLPLPGSIGVLGSKGIRELSFIAGALLGKLLPFPVSPGVWGIKGIIELPFTPGACMVVTGSKELSFISGSTLTEGISSGIGAFLGVGITKVGQVVLPGS